jgi:hypothetical protein
MERVRYTTHIRELDALLWRAMAEQAALAELERAAAEAAQKVAAARTKLAALPA